MSTRRLLSLTTLAIAIAVGTASVACSGTNDATIVRPAETKESGLPCCHGGYIHRCANESALNACSNANRDETDCTKTSTMCGTPAPSTTGTTVSPAPSTTGTTVPPAPSTTGTTVPPGPCTPGSFGLNGACMAWRTCPPGNTVEVEGTATSDRACRQCAPGSFSTSSNATACSPCASGTFVSASGATSCTARATCGVDRVDLVFGVTKASEDAVCARVRQFRTNSRDFADAVAVDASGNILLAGVTEKSFGDRDIFVRKYDAAGNLVWAREFGSRGSDDSVGGIAVDASGNVVVAGSSFGTLAGQTTAGGADAFVQKYDASGTLLWTRQYGSNKNDGVRSIALDSSGNIVVGGGTFGALPGQASSGNDDVFVQKFNAAGGLLWTRQYGSSNSDSATGIAVDASGNVLVGGNAPDPFVQKYDGDGALMWTRQLSGGLMNAVGVDASGNVVVAGSAFGALPGQTSAGNTDAFVQKYDGAGTLMWTRQFGSSAVDSAKGIATDASGNVLVTGFTNGVLPRQTSVGNTDIFIRKFDSLGSELRTLQFGSTSEDSASGLAVDAAGHALVAGYTLGVLQPTQTNFGFANAFFAAFAL